MAVKKKLMKTTWYPNNHRDQVNFRFGLETAVANNYTIIPVCHYDEGLGTASALETNPENASFVVDNTTSIYPNSTVENVFLELKMTMTKDALETDKIHSINFCYMPIYLNFLEDYTATDELSGLSVEDLLLMTHETTDRQGSPLFNNVKMVIGNPGYELYGATVPGMDTTQAAEGVAFAYNTFYDALQWFTNGNKLKTVQGGIKWRTLTKTRPTFRTRIKLHSSVKRANEYMFAGIMVGVPPVADIKQTQLAAEVTNVAHINCDLEYRYYEWNENFNNAAD